MGKLIYGSGIGGSTFGIPDEILVGLESALSEFVRHDKTFEISLRGEDPEARLFTLYVTPGVPLQLAYDEPTKLTDEAREIAKELRKGLRDGEIILDGFTNTIPD